MLVTMSPGLVAAPSGMFSQVGITPMTLQPRFSSAQAVSAPNTLAAPHMSYFISSIVGDGLMEMPPVSKVTPLPTSTMGLSFVLPPLYSAIMSLGASREPAVTDSKAPMPSFSICAFSIMVTFSAGYLLLMARACLAR